MGYVNCVDVLVFSDPVVVGVHVPKIVAPATGKGVDSIDVCTAMFFMQFYYEWNQLTLLMELNRAGGCIEPICPLFPVYLNWF